MLAAAGVQGHVAILGIEALDLVHGSGTTRPVGVDRPEGGLGVSGFGQALEPFDLGHQVRSLRRASSSTASSSPACAMSRIGFLTPASRRAIASLPRMQAMRPRTTQPRQRRRECESWTSSWRDPVTVRAPERGIRPLERGLSHVPCCEAGARDAGSGTRRARRRSCDSRSWDRCIPRGPGPGAA